MDQDETKELIKQFDSMKVKCPSQAMATPPVPLQQIPQMSLSQLQSEEANQVVNHMSISADDSNILTLPKVTLEAMWDKANEYIM